MDALEKIQLVYKAITEKKGFQIALLDLRDLAAFTDFFIICSGNSVTQTKAIAEEIELTLKNAKVNYQAEGYQAGSWILVDCFDLVIHIFLPETRDYYDLEMFWGDAPRIFEHDLEEKLLKIKN